MKIGLNFTLKLHTQKQIFFVLLKLICIDLLKSERRMLFIVWNKNCSLPFCVLPIELQDRESSPQILLRLLKAVLPSLFSLSDRETEIRLVN